MNTTTRELFKECHDDELHEKCLQCHSVLPLIIDEGDKSKGKEKKKKEKKMRQKEVPFPPLNQVT